MKTHNLKTLPEYFYAVKTGVKTFEIRVNDRDYQIGDILNLQEWGITGYSYVSPSKMLGGYSGKEFKVKVTYIFQNDKDYFLVPLMPNYVCMSIVPYKSKKKLQLRH